ncbi:MAG TPA: ABC transporter substrate-binding protein [Burkholderiales bacterium]|jgi:putative ABC transport system substrate-binding protein|nr:ABC transporter substrate-binding protein [Burkholderiales bacterium]
MTTPGGKRTRREFFRLLGCGVVLLPFHAHSQQSGRMRRAGVLMNIASDDPQGRLGVAAFQEALQLSGWSETNLRIDIQWGTNDLDRQRKNAAQLAALAPEVILASGTVSVLAIQHVAKAIPVVFVRVADPLGAGLVDNLAQPGGTVTGFMLFEYSLSGKWLELLKEVAPRVTRVAVLRDAQNPAGMAQFGVIQATSRMVGVEVIPVSDRNVDELQRAIGSFAQSPKGGLIATATATSSVHHDAIVKLAERYKLPAVYADRLDGALISYGPDRVHQFRLAAGYVGRILKGERPGRLPVQAPTKYELVVNLRTAKALGLSVPPSLLARADQVIE